VILVADTSRLYFRCPRCQQLHQKEIDVNVVIARIGYRCAQNDGGCGQIFWLTFALDADLEVSALPQPADADYA
jgi:hypothetical protein